MEGNDGLVIIYRGALSVTHTAAVTAAVLNRRD
jgi:hypothetical protein